MPSTYGTGRLGNVADLSAKTIRWMALCLGGLLSVQAVQAAERVTFRNGFSMECQRQVAVDSGHTRLLLDADGVSYMDVETGAIARVEHVDAAVSQKQGAVPVARVKVMAVERRDMSQMIATAGNAHNINVALLESVVNAESGGHAGAVSHAGAQGLMQLMPATARSMGVTDSFAPEENLRGGSTYLDRLLTRYHNDVALALAAYNAGPGAVDRYHGVPPYRETVLYVSRIIREFNRRTLLEQKHAAAERVVATRTAVSQAVATVGATLP